MLKLLKNIAQAKNAEHLLITKITPEVTLGEVITVCIAGYENITGKVISTVSKSGRDNYLTIEPIKGTIGYNVIKNSTIIYDPKTNTGRMCIVNKNCNVKADAT